MMTPDEAKLLPSKFDPKTGAASPIRQMRPQEVQSAKDELAGVERLLDPSHSFVNSNVDVPEARRFAGAMKEKLETETPRGLAPEERDAAVSLESRLRDGWSQGMLTQEEMRRNPAGAVDRHMAWEKAKKTSIEAWKNLRQRMRASGMIEGDVDASNIELYRPSGGAQQMNMHNEQIQGAIIHLPPAGAGPATVLSDEELTRAPVGTSLLSNDERAELKAELRAEIEAELEIKPKKPKRTISPEHLAKLAAGRDRRKAQLASEQQPEV